MSQENVEIVKAVAPPSGAELTSLFADDSGAPERLEAIAPLFHAEFEFEAHGAPGAATAGSGLQELVEEWRDWIQPFDTWRTEVEEFVDVDDDRVLVLIRDHVRPRGGDVWVSRGIGVRDRWDRAPSGASFSWDGAMLSAVEGL